MNAIDDLDELHQFASMLIGGGAESYVELLKRVVEILGAKSGTIWSCESSGFAPIASVLSSPTPLKLGISKAEHEKVLQQVWQQQRSAIVRAEAKDNQSETLHLYAAPIKSSNKEVLELTFSVGTDQNRLQSIIQRLTRIPSLFEGFRKATPSNSASTNATSTKIQLDVFTVSRFAQTVHSSIDYPLVCASIANEARLLLDCDRVSVLRCVGSKFKLVSISGQPSVNRRSNCAVLLEDTANEILRARQDFWYPSGSVIAPQIQEKLEKYLISSPTRSLVVCPIFKDGKSTGETVNDSAQNHRSMIGGIVFEHFKSEWNPSKYGDAVGLVLSHASTSLRNATEHQELFLYPLWRFIGKSRLLKSARSLPRAMVAVSLASLVTAFLALWQVPFYVSASGRLLPEKRQYVFAKTSGEVVSVAVQQGQNVSESETVLLLKSEDLQLRLSEVNGQIETLLERKSALERNKFETASRQSNEALEQNLGSLQAEIQALKNQLASLQRIEMHLTVQSPMSGKVISWDPQQKLLGRTVNPQDVLLEVADVEGPWQLQLDIEDRRIEHLVRSQSKGEAIPLKVKYSLVADPSKNHEGELSGMGNSIQLSEGNQQVLRVVVDVDESDLEIKQVNTGVTAKIYTGESTSIGYLWLHEVPRALNRYLFFYLQR